MFYESRIPPMPHFHVAAAVLVCRDRILCLQRGACAHDYISFRFEFPGGKIEPGETTEEALMRELSEELDLSVPVSPDDFFMTVHHVYPDFEVTMAVYRCPVSSFEFRKKEHAAHVWALPENLMTLDWMAADRPIVEELCRRAGSGHRAPRCSGGPA